MADIALQAKATQNAPMDYTVPGGQEILLKTMRARFDGTGAAGSFVPAIILRDPFGNEVGCYDLGSTLAAGVSADCTFFPGGRLATARSLTPGLGDFLAADTTVHQSIANDGLFHRIVFDDGVFAGGAGSVTLNADKMTVQLANAGSYDVSCSVQWDNTDQTGSRMVSADIVDYLPTKNIDLFGQTSITTKAASDFPNPAPLQEYHWTPVFNPGGKFAMNVAVKGAAGAVLINYAQITVVYVAPLGN